MGPIPKLERNLPPQDPLEYIDVDAELNLNKHIKKTANNNEVIRQIALETINIKYPKDKWFHVYTDGSLLKQYDGAGAGVHSAYFNHYFKLPDNTTVFEGELAAIECALKQILGRRIKDQQIVILSDSQAALQKEKQSRENLLREKTYENISKEYDKIANFTRKRAVAHFRLYTGHNCLNDHLHRMGLVQNKLCTLCDLNRVQDAEHLTKCPQLAVSRQINNDLTYLYWAARMKMI
ncbi:uncharacterized protein LOC129613726 [Condylostylus longicornis]|uniref:uncharacterized protein LOC129613726 n=1 Tax=Condylostylus longicornis TaxID=2530218 RepID=UPI00244DCADC|nr:uncharacterized protein LOC129613726 [Condylostylus longicornis]